MMHKKLSPKEIGSRLQKVLEDVKLNRCHVCKVPYIPAEDCTVLSGPRKGKWDGYSYKGNCGHFPKNLRISIG